MSFEPVVVDGVLWNFEHLMPFSFPYTILTGGNQITLHIDVCFSCHCFTRKPTPNNEEIEKLYIYRTATETRVLDKTRYAHSRELLPLIIKDFDERKILFASTENYMTLETSNAQGIQGYYQVFFTVKRKEGVRNRLGLIVQSAYFVDYLHRQAKPTSRRSVRFKLIATAAYERRKLQPGR